MYSHPRYLPRRHCVKVFNAQKLLGAPWEGADGSGRRDSEPTRTPRATGATTVSPRDSRTSPRSPQPRADPAAPRPSDPPLLGRPSKEKANVRFCIENIYFTTVVSDNLAIFILVYIQTYKTQITMLKHKIIPSAVTACMYRSSVVSSVTIHRVQTATSTYIQFKVWSFSNITKYIYVYIIIAFQMHLYFDCGFFFFISPPRPSCSTVQMQNAVPSQRPQLPKASYRGQHNQTPP